MSCMSGPAFNSRTNYSRRHHTVTQLICLFSTQIVAGGAWGVQPKMFIAAAVLLARENPGAVFCKRDARANDPSFLLAQKDAIVIAWVVKVRFSH